jgi:hypothetical protein
MIWIISGPTAVGKSTFIMSPRCAELTGLSPETRVIWAARASKVSKADELDQFASTDVLFHYNIMRLRELKRLNRRSTDSAQEDSGFGKRRGFRFARIREWDSVTKNSAPKKAVVLIASKQTISQRMELVRRKDSLRGEKKNSTNHKWLSLLESIDLAALYKDWLQELRDNSIPYVLVDSTGDTFPIIEDEDALEDIVNGTPASNSNLEPSQASAARDD